MNPSRLMLTARNEAKGMDTLCTFLQLPGLRQRLTIFIIMGIQKETVRDANLYGVRMSYFFSYVYIWSGVSYICAVFRFFLTLSCGLYHAFVSLTQISSSNIRPTRTHFWVEDPSRGRYFTYFDDGALTIDEFEFAEFSRYFISRSTLFQGCLDALEADQDCPYDSCRI